MKQRFGLGGERSAGIASVDEIAGLQQEHCRLRIGARAAFGAPRHDEQLAQAEDHIAVTHLDGDLAAKHGAWAARIPGPSGRRAVAADDPVRLGYECPAWPDSGGPGSRWRGAQDPSPPCW